VRGGLTKYADAVIMPYRLLSFIGGEVPKKLTTEEFIERSRAVHGDKYDYSKAVYGGSSADIQIICPTHGMFSQRAYIHLHGAGCSSCAGLTRYTTSGFVLAAKQIHGDKYDYSKSVYVSSKIKIIIQCPIHGEFMQTPSNHLMGDGCSECGVISTANHRRYSVASFIEQAHKMHNNFYTYEQVIYKNIKIPVIITCPIHGEFHQTPDSHLRGKGCILCGQTRTSNSRRGDLPSFIEEAKKIHGDRYDYSKAVYESTHAKLEIICVIHGSFWQDPANHKKGVGCPICSGKFRKTTEQFIIDACARHGNKYDYSKCVYVRAFDKVEIICPVHGSFWQTPAKHTYEDGCPKCKASKWENLISRLLETQCIPFASEYRIPDCIYKKPLPFDFAVFIDTDKKYLKCLIEYDGEHHYRVSMDWGGENALKEVQRRDSIKTQYCVHNNIKLIRIPYWEKDNIEDILRKELI